MDSLRKAVTDARQQITLDSNRLPHHKRISFNDTTILCPICNSFVRISEQAVKNHVKTQKHQKYVADPKEWKDIPVW